MTPISGNPALSINDLFNSTTKGFNRHQYNKWLRLTIAEQQDIATLFTIIAGSVPAGVTANLQYNNAGVFGAIPDGTIGQALVSQGPGVPPIWATSSRAYIYLPMAGTSLTLIPANFNGRNIVGFTDTSGNVTVTLPDATLVTAGQSIYLNMIGGDTLSIKNSVSGQTLDGVNINSAVIVNPPTYPGGNFTPAQQIGIYSDGTNFHVVSNY